MRTVDLLHIDVQGVEFELLQATAGAVQEHTTDGGRHAQPLERGSTAVLLPRAWLGLIDRLPVHSRFTMTHPTLSSFTEQDGMQLYENPFVL